MSTQECNCNNCYTEPNLRCKTCTEACLDCQDKHDPEWRGIQAGRLEEQTRILKLLKAEMELQVENETFDPFEVINKLISDIKGEPNV
jgi:hypothetical protein